MNHPTPATPQTDDDPMNPPNGLPTPVTIPPLPPVKPDVAELASTITGLGDLEVEKTNIIIAGADPERTEVVIQKVRIVTQHLANLLAAVDHAIATITVEHGLNPDADEAFARLAFTRGAVEGARQ